MISNYYVVLQKMMDELGILFVVPPKSFFQSDSVRGSLHSVSSETGSDSLNSHTRVETMDASRISLSIFQAFTSSLG